MVIEELVSIIVPVYNVQQYVSDCIESIQKQTYRNIEIILVDDGSNDSSGIICDDYKKRDSRIKVIHKENGGLSSARNVGINNSKGMYLAFIDSDDVLDTRYVEELLALIYEYNADIAQTNWCYFRDGDEIPLVKWVSGCGHRCFSGKEMCYNLFNSEYSSGVVQTKLFTRKIFDCFRFPEGLLHEDDAVTYKLFWKSQKVAVTKNKLYFYRVGRIGSIMQSQSLKKICDGLKAKKERMEFFNIECDEKELCDLALLSYTYGLCNAVDNMKKNRISEKYEEILCEKKKYTAQVYCNKRIKLKSKVRVLLSSSFRPIYRVVDKIQDEIILWNYNKQ